MNNKVRVTADKNGNVVGVSQNNPEYGYIRVEQRVIQVNDQGWLRNTKRSALIKGKVEDLVECAYQEGETLPGKIVVMESFKPFNSLNPDRDLKIAGSTGIICRVDDQPIYRQSFYTTNPNAVDELIMHDNSEEIKGLKKQIYKDLKPENRNFIFKENNYFDIDTGESLTDFTPSENLKKLINTI